MAQKPEVPPSDHGTDSESDPVVPITSRFLFVDVAAQRAKQLRRGALVRLDRHAPPMPHKLERVAMEEVRTGLVHYSLPTAADILGIP